MYKRVLIIAGIFIVLCVGIGVSLHAERPNVRILMLSGKKLLVNGDSIGAKEKFEEILRFDPTNEAAKSFLQQLSGVSSAKEEDSEEIKEEKTEKAVEIKGEEDSVVEIKEEVTEKTVEIKEEDTEDPIGNRPSPLDPFAGAIKHKSTKGTDRNAAHLDDKGQTDQTKNEGKAQATTGNSTESNNNQEKTATNTRLNTDPVAIKYYNTNGKQLLHFSHVPTAPLAGCDSVNTNADVIGRWMSSLRNMRDNGHEMLTISIDENSGEYVYDESRSELLHLCSAAGYYVNEISLNEDNGDINGEIEIGLKAKDREEILGIADNLLKPFLGAYGLSDHKTFDWMAVGDLVTDTVIVPRTVYISDQMNDSIAVRNTVGAVDIESSVADVEAPDSIIVNDTTFTQRRVIPDSYYVSIKFGIYIKKADKLLPATFTITAQAKASTRREGDEISGSRQFPVLVAPTRTVSIAEVTVPLTFVRAPEGYKWIDENDLAAKADSTQSIKLKDIAMDKHTINNLGYDLLNGIGTERDYVTALKLFDRANSLNSNEALSNLYLIYSEGLGTPKDMDKAFELLATGRERELSEALYQSANMLYTIDALDDEAKAWLEEAVKKNNPAAIMLKAQMLECGIGMEKDIEEAKRLYNQARDLDYPDAGYHLARLLMAEDSPSEAYTCLTTSVDSPAAMQMIAELYITGIVVHPNMKKAVKWLNDMQRTVKNQKIGYRYER